MILTLELISNQLVLVFTKGEDRYIFIYDRMYIFETVKKLGQFASNPELNMTWSDAAALAEEMFV